MRRAKTTIAAAKIVAAAKEPTRDVPILRRSRHRKSIVVIVTVSFTGRSVTWLTSKGAKTFAVNQKSVTNGAKNTSTTRRRNMSVEKPFVATAKKRKMSIIVASFSRLKKKKKKKTAWGLCTEAEEFEEADNEADCKEEEKEKVEPLVCAIDFECSVDEIKDFKDVCVGWRYLDVEGSYREAGTAIEMLTDVMANTMTEEGKERKVFVYAHNMRGFDSLFILAVLYDMGYKIDRILSMGAKYLSFECGNLVFRDSLNFFNMPLERLPGTFNLTETHKGFFAYSWIREDKMNYVGCYPPAADYHPERMSEKRRKEFLAWHQEKVESGAVFDFQKELSAYLKSDVQVLSQSLEAFGKEMLELTGINPITECVTIASTAFKVWQKMFL